MRATDAEAELTAHIGRFTHDPLGFVNFAFPWGEPGTALEKRKGPQQWQADELGELGIALSTGNRKTRRAVASGKGIGKSALVSWVGLYGLCTFPNTKVLVTAGTEPQLRTKLMPEVAKWFRMLICAHWFANTSTSIYVNDPSPMAQKEWRLDALPWNANNPEAFQGLHNQGRRIIVIFDEASQIDDRIFDATDGVFSDADTEVAWLAYGNPTRSLGRFREAFDPKSRWKTRHIDSRDADITDKQELAELVEEHGEDSDYIRWTVRGLFPRAASTQFIALEDVQQAQRNDAFATKDDPLIFGVDVARQGGAKSVIAVRRGRDCRSIPWRVLQGHDLHLGLMTLVNTIAAMAQEYKPDAIHVDIGGMGAGVVDRLLELRVPHVVGVNFGSSSDNPIPGNPMKYVNKRSEMWGTMKYMLPSIGIPESKDLEKDLTAQLYGYKADSLVQLVSKEIMLKQHGIPSPDFGDALALTFAYPVLSRRPGGMMERVQSSASGAQGRALTEYNPLA